MSAAINLQQFCSRSDDIREHLRKPWTYNGYRYGCNGHIMVRVPAANELNSPSHSLTQSAEKLLIERAAVSKNYIALPHFPAPKVCIGCGGDGQRLMVKCENCDGDGYFERGQYEYECKECDGAGLLDVDDGADGAAMHDCPECHGIGFYREGAPVGDVHFDVVHLRLLANLPSLRLCTHGYDKGAHFTFDGGEGVLMPRRPD